MAKKHDERCKACKKMVEQLLSVLYGEVKTNYNLDLPSNIDGYSGSVFETELETIYTTLQKYRGHDSFVKAKKLPNVDYFVPSPGFIVEFDESQHFSKPREIVLSKYPDSLNLGFNKRKWRNLCVSLNRKDNDPVYRDEQRAWYDTLRDFAPTILKLKPTIRIFASDTVWCSLNPNVKSDHNIFKKTIKVIDK